MADSPTKLCFVIGPIGPADSEVRLHADWLLEEIIQPVVRDFPDYHLRRADQDQRPGLIDAQMINDLLTAELVIADLSSLNANAFYEIGIRHTAQKPIIHMQIVGENIPFDISLYRAIPFSRTWPKDLRAARESLKSQIAAVHAAGFQVENPVTRARGIVKLDEHATPEQTILREKIELLMRRISDMEDNLWYRGPPYSSPIPVAPTPTPVTTMPITGMPGPIASFTTSRTETAHFSVSVADLSGSEKIQRLNALRTIITEAFSDSVAFSDSEGLQVLLPKEDTRHFETLYQTNNLFKEAIVTFRGLQSRNRRM